MKTGTILAAIAILCILTGCTKKPAPTKARVSGPHSIGIEVTKQVMVGKEITATASWEGGTPPFDITWSFPNTIDKRASREATSPDTIKFVIPANKAKIGQKYRIRASITDAKGVSSVIQERFLLVRDPQESNPSLLRAITH